MIEREDGFAYPIIDASQCVRCGLCNKVCPADNVKKISDSNIKLYAGYIDDKRITQTSSGAVYPQLLDAFFDRYPNGVAYGVRIQGGITEHFELHYGQDYSPAYGSKYTQSNLQIVFSKVKEYLKDNIAVLFSGTPCQVAAIKNYVLSGGGTQQGKLITQAVLCHGVASPKVLKKYIEYWENKEQDEIVGIHFRAKDLGWIKYGMKLLFKNGETKFIESKDDLFYKTFGSNYSLRESCYHCEYKYPNYHADIVLGDFWNVESIKPAFYNRQGTSIAFGVTDAGRLILRDIITHGQFCNITIEQALQSQKGIVEYTPRPKKREEFFRDIDNNDFSEYVKKYTKIPPHRKLRILLGKGLRRIRTYMKRWLNE